MIPAVSRNGRFVVWVGLVCLLIVWGGYYQPHLCLLHQCPTTTFQQAHSNNNIHYDAGLPVGSSPSRPDPPSPHIDDKNTETDLSKPDAPFIAWPLARVCAETTRWTPGLIFVCDNNSGGIGNIRNFILTCLRYAIEAGATGLILPTIQTRSEEKLADLFVGRKVAFSHFFDEMHLRESLEAACPRMVIYDDVNGVPGVWEAEENMAEDTREEGERLSAWKQKTPEMITPKHFGLRGGCDQRDLNRHTDLFGARFHAWLATRQEQQEHLPGAAPYSASHPKLIRFSWGVQWDWPVYRDGPEFTATFGGLLRLRPDVLALGKKMVALMKEEMGSVGQGGFLGVHLRTEDDALSNWPSFDEQAGAYLARASMLDPPPRLAYVATGNASEAARFDGLAAKQQLRVVTKRELLQKEEEELGRLDKLSWDQQALVDFVVLLYADFFVGVSPSSFSMNVALKRHLRSEGIYTRPWRVGGEEGDGRSWLVGNYESYWEDWLFMYDSLWP